MSKGLEPGAILPDFELPDEDGVRHKLSELQGDNLMVLMLGRGEHCPRARHHQREMQRFYQWCPVAFTSLVTVLPNEAHDVFKLRASTGATWPYLSDTDLEVQRTLDITPGWAGRLTKVRAQAVSGGSAGRRARTARR